MTKMIYKFGPLSSWNNTLVTGRIVHVGIQGMSIYVWAELGDGINETHNVRYTGTGMQYDGEYVGTVVEDNGLVWHVIEERV
jgi:hypothetical protein